MRWQRGEFSGYVEGRCKATNLCDYCAIQAAHENARMLTMDAAEDLDRVAQIVAILGTRSATEDPKPFYRGREKVMKALRRRWPEAEYASLVEFTTGKGKHSGGRRRPHWNIVLKGISAGDLDEAREIVRRIWCQHVDAEPEAQYVEALQSTAAFMRYVAMHFQKESQAPPKGWSGQRFNCSRGYFYGRTRAHVRALARRELQREREIFKARRDHPEFEPELVLELADLRLERAAATSWRIVAATPLRAELVLRGDQRSIRRLEAGASNPPSRRLDSG